MTRVDFYVLEDSADTARARFACRLAEKAWRLKHTVHLHVGSDGEARQLDSLLWTFDDGSFLPHVLDTPGLEPGLAAATPVRIGCGAPSREAEILVNLDDTVPLFFSNFDRVAEIVGGDATRRAAARERFRFYRDRGYAMKTHQIGSGT